MAARCKKCSEGQLGIFCNNFESIKRSGTSSGTGEKVPGSNASKYACEIQNNV